MPTRDPRPLTPLRRQTRPRSDDTLASLAARELPEVDPEEAVELIRSWNPHLGFFRAIPRPLLVSDIVYLEPPPEV